MSSMFGISLEMAASTERGGAAPRVRMFGSNCFSESDTFTTFYYTGFYPVILYTALSGLCRLWIFILPEKTLTKKT